MGYGRRFSPRPFQDVAHNVLAALLKFIKASPSRPVRWDGILRLPLATGISVEIIAGIDTLIEQIGRETHVFLGTEALVWATAQAQERYKQIRTL